MDLKKAITNFLNEQINDIYQEMFGATAERPFVFECDFTRDNRGEFELYDENGRIVVDDKLNYVKYIPSSVYSLIADRIEIPNIQILDTLIPIEMFVSNEMLEVVMQVLNTFQEKINGKPFMLKNINYQGEEKDFSIIMTFNLPSDDDFQVFNGINGKIIDFQISANITCDIIFGNDIQYELSIDNGETFEPIIKMNPQSVYALTPYSDQIIGTPRVKNTPQTAVWSLDIDAIVKKGSIFEDLTLYADIPYTDLDIGYIGDKTFLKTIYSFKKSIRASKFLSEYESVEVLTSCPRYIDMQKEMEELVKVSGSTNYQLTISYGEIDITFNYLNNNYFIRIEKNSSVLKIIALMITGGSDILYDDADYNEYNIKYIASEKRLYFLKRDDLIITNTFPSEVKLAELFYSNFYIKPVLITLITPNFENGDIASIHLEIKDRL